MEMQIDNARWLQDGTRRDGGTRLFCLPPAGAGASSFEGWPELLGPAVDVTAVQLPGREDRVLEPAHRRLDGLLDELVPVLADALDGPYALFGHGMGALIAYEAARRLVAQGAPPPRHLFASALGAPHAAHRRRYVSRLSEPDFQLCATYEYVDGPPLPCRVTVLIGEDDDIPPLELALWRELSTGPFRIRIIDGDHGFVVMQARQVAEVIRAGLVGVL